MVLLLQIVGAVAALGFGLWLGMPKSYRPHWDGIEEAMGKEKPRAKATRHFTFLGFLQKRQEKGSERRLRRDRRSRKPFDLS
ncbi:MAG: hypothetical protein WEA09_08990 [Gemmatimonadota bacterium]